MNVAGTDVANDGLKLRNRIGDARQFERRCDCLRSDGQMMGLTNWMSDENQTADVD